MSKHSDETRETRRRMADALFEAMGDDYVPLAMIGLTLEGQITDPDAFRTAMPEAVREFLVHGGAEAMIAQFAYTAREFAKHPEDIGPIDPAKWRKEGDGAHEA